MLQTLVVADPLADLAQLDGVGSAVEAARAAVDSVLRDRGLRVVSAEQSAAALLAGARASAALTDDPPRWLAGAIRLSTELVPLSELIRVAPGQAMARAHALVARGLVPEDDLGRIRGDAATTARIRGLNELLTRPTAASGVVLAAVAHAELLASGAFDTANGIVARAVEHLVLVAAGVDPRAALVPEQGHLVLRHSYQISLARYREGTVSGVREWLLHCAQALTHGAEASPLAASPMGRRRD